MIPHPTSKKDFRAFREAFAWWQERLGLSCWDVDFTHKAQPPGELASCASDSEASAATVNLAKSWGSHKVMPEQLHITALHEALELMFAPMCEIAANRDFSPTQLDREKHRVIGQLEKVLGKTKE